MLLVGFANFFRIDRNKISLFSNIQSGRLIKVKDMVFGLGFDYICDVKINNGEEWSGNQTTQKTDLNI